MPSLPLDQRPPTWALLPRELWRLIFQVLIDEGYPLSKLVTVSRQWQRDLEPHIFARIRITPSRAVDFDAMTRRNNALVRYIWLCLELDEYTFGFLFFREEYFSPRDPERCRVGNESLCNPFRHLFSALSTWNDRDDLTLDISIYSPSDWKHSFAYLSVLPDTYPKMLKGLGSDQPAAAEASDPQHHPWHALDADLGVTVGHFIALKETFATMEEGPFDTETACAWWQQLPTVSRESTAPATAEPPQMVTRSTSPHVYPIFESQRTLL